MKTLLKCEINLPCINYRYKGNIMNKNFIKYLYENYTQKMAHVKIVHLYLVLSPPNTTHTKHNAFYSIAFKIIFQC